MSEEKKIIETKNMILNDGKTVIKNSDGTQSTVEYRYTDDVTYKVPSSTVHAVLPRSATEIKECAFFEYVNLISVEIPESVTKSAAEPFFVAKSLKESFYPKVLRR